MFTERGESLRSVAREYPQFWREVGSVNVIGMVIPRWEFCAERTSVEASILSVVAGCLRAAAPFRYISIGRRRALNDCGEGTGK